MSKLYVGFYTKFVFPLNSICMYAYILTEKSHKSWGMYLSDFFVMSVLTKLHPIQSMWKYKRKKKDEEED